MKDIIHKINQRSVMVAIKTEQGDFPIFENINAREFNICDEVSCVNNTGVCKQQLYNITQYYLVNIIFENHF